MHAYLLTGLTLRTQFLPNASNKGPAEKFQTWDACQTIIAFGESLDEAQKKFEAWLRRPPEDGSPVGVEIKKIASAQFADELFTESGPAPLDWAAILKQMEVLLEATPVDDFEQGYWVDVEQVIPREPLSAGIEELQRGVPEDISSGLNWSSDKQFIFVLSLLTPPSLPPGFGGEPEIIPAEDDDLPDQGAEESPAELHALVETYPQAADKQAGALIQARNSVVAAWLWRRYVAGQQLAALPIRIDPWCGVLELPPASPSSADVSES